MDRRYTIPDVKRALNLSDFDALKAQLRMTPTSRAIRRPAERTGDVRLGGVMLLLYLEEGELYTILTRRRDDLNSHAGQMSFPGGQRDDGETLLMTALRETEEEVGILASDLEVLGQLSTLYIPPSDFEVHPFVAWVKNGRRPQFSPNPQEVAEIVEMPISSLFNPSYRGEEPWEIRGLTISVPFYRAGDYKVWGATAMIISEFVERLRLARTEASQSAAN
ncbi:MAG: CoA pyrophosphatase [Candidatus Promineifilaceae bacterium]|nr:CoA pyrophosphatase [Candidatus Promineifilaceae bacterium]